MAVTVPSTDLVNYNLQQTIANLGTLITSANTLGNYPLALALTKIQANTQLQLVLSLLGSGGLVPATVISTMSYVTPTVGAGGTQ